MRESFNTNVEAVTHDSDPKFLRFFQVDRDTGNETIYGGNLGAANNPTPLPPFDGPKIGDLTGGISPIVFPIYDDITGGDFTLTVTCTDTTTAAKTIGFAEFKTTADDQGKGNHNDDKVDMVLSYSGGTDWGPVLSGKTIDTLRISLNTPITSSSGTNNSATTFIRFYVGNDHFVELDDITQIGTNEVTGLGLAFDVLSMDPLVRIKQDYVGSGAPNTISIITEPPAELNATYWGLVQGNVTVRFTDTEANNYDFPITFTALKTVAATIGLQKYSATSFQLGWDLSALIGHTIASIYFVGPGASSWKFGFSALSSNFVGSNSSLEVVYNLNQSNPAIYPGSFMRNPDDLIIGAVGALPYDGTFNFNIVIELRSGPELNTPVSVNVAATDILSGLSVPQKDESRHINYPPMPIEDIGTGDQQGFLVTSIEFNGVGTYGMSGATITSNVQFIVEFNDNPNQYHAGGMHGITLGTNDTIVPTFEPFKLASVDYGAHLGMYFDLYPSSTPETNLPLLMTEPYELRQRNIPAFRLMFNRVDGEETYPAVNVQMLASQGPINSGSSISWEWTPIPCDVLLKATATKEVETPLLTVNGTNIDNMPLNYGGVMLTVPKEYVGPWNYIRLWFYAQAPVEGVRQEQFLNGHIVLVQANAREL